MEDGVATVKLSDGSTAQSAALDFGSDAKNELYDKIPRIEGMAPESADALIGEYSETSGISAQQYARAVEDGYLYGSVGLRMENIPRGSDFWGLSESQRKLAYELGTTVRAKKDAAREAEIERLKAENYRSADENENVLSMIDRVNKGEAKGNEKVYLGTVSASAAAEIQNITGINVDGFKVAIEARQVEHILKRHGEKGTSDKSMSDPADIAKIEYTLDNYDDIRPAGRTRAYKHSVNGKTEWTDTVLYEKEIADRSYYVVQAVPDTKAKTLYIVTAFIGKPGYMKEASQFIDAQSPDATPKSEIASTSIHSIPDSVGNVNSSSKNNSKEAKAEAIREKATELQRVENKSTGESIVIDRDNAIARVVTRNGEPVVYFNTDKGVIPDTDIEFGSLEKWMAYAFMTDKGLDVSILNRLIASFDESTPALEIEFQGGIEGGIEYGRSGEKGYLYDKHFDSLPEKYRELSVKLGRENAAIEAKSKEMPSIQALSTENGRINPIFKGKETLDEASVDAAILRRGADGGGDVTIDREHAIARTETVDGERVVYFNTDKGEVRADDLINYGNVGAMKLREAVAKMEPVVGNAVYASYDSGLLGDLSTLSFVRGMQEGIEAGRKGADASNVESADFDALPESYQELAVKLGEFAQEIESGIDVSSIEREVDLTLREAMRDAKEALTRTNEGNTQVTEQNADASTEVSAEVTVSKTEQVADGSSVAVSKTEKTTRKEGTVTVKADESTLSERQKVSVECLRSLSKAIGVNFVVENLSTRTAAGRVGENGRFDRKTNTVYLDLNAGNDGEGVILYTASHELTHFIAKWSPAKYKVLREALFGFYGQTNKDVIAMAREQMAAAKEAGHPITFDAAIEEVVADAMERMLTDGNAQTFFETLEKKDKSLVEKIKSYFAELLAKIRRAYEGAAFQSDEAQFLHESAEAVERIQALFFDALNDAGETYREIGDGKENSQMSVDSESFSVRKGQGNQEITSADVEAIRSIGRKSINKFTSEDIHKAEKWARKFYTELGAKSPFFRAWFGDWRAHSKDPVTVTNIPKSRQSNQRQNVVCQDTGWTVRISGHGERNTRAHAGGEYLSVRGLNNIVELIENAIFLDSEIHEHHDNNAPNEMISFDHKCYSLGKDNRGSIALYKITIEDIFQSRSEPNDLRFHNLRYIKEIKKVVEDISGSSDQSDQPYTANSDTSTTTYSISDLFDFVKRYDTEFFPKSVNPTMLNPDGTPKVFYHGTNADFTAFDRKKIGSNTDDGVYGKGFYFSSNRSQAEQYGGSKEYFLSLKNPLVLSDYHSIGELADALDMSESNFSMSGGVIHPLNSYINSFTSHLQYAGYDGVIVDYGTSDEVVVFDSTQIKSATDNIGTFDGSNPDIRYSVRKSNRSTLTAALDSVVTDPEERRILDVYRANIENLDTQQERLQELNAEIKNLSFSDGAKDRARVSELRQEAIKTQNRINLYDKKLLGLEAMAPMKRVVERQAQKAYEKAAERGRETLTKRRESINIHFLCRNYSFCVKK